MTFRTAARWIGWISFGGFLGVFSLCLTAFLWCLPYMTEESYCTGDAPIVGYMLVVSSPWAIILGAVIASKILKKQALREALAREAKRYEEEALDAAPASTGNA